MGFSGLLVLAVLAKSPRTEWPCDARAQAAVEKLVQMAEKKYGTRPTASCVCRDATCTKLGESIVAVPLRHRAVTANLAIRREPDHPDQGSKQANPLEDAAAARALLDRLVQQPVFKVLAGLGTVECTVEAFWGRRYSVGCGTRVPPDQFLGHPVPLPARDGGHGEFIAAYGARFAELLEPGHERAGAPPLAVVSYTLPLSALPDAFDEVRLARENRHAAAGLQAENLLVEFDRGSGETRAFFTNEPSLPDRLKSSAVKLRVFYEDGGVIVCPGSISPRCAN